MAELAGGSLAGLDQQHPGERDGYSLDKPLSHWPDGGESVARPAVVVVWKTDGKIGLLANYRVPNGSIVHAM